MGLEGDIWRLLRGPEPVGDIVIDDHDVPWLQGRFVPGMRLPAGPSRLHAQISDVERHELGPSSPQPRRPGTTGCAGTGP